MYQTAILLTALFAVGTLPMIFSESSTRQKIKHLILTLIIYAPLCFFLLQGWSDTLKTSTPADTDDPREADDRMREIKAAFVERLDIDHYFPASATSTYDATDTGMHRYITFQGPNTTPATIAENQARVYTKDVDSKAELHWIDEDENEIQITSVGEILYTSIKDVANDTYITAIDAAGTGTADLIKADANDAAVLPDDARLASTGAPDEDAEIANKKYVDDKAIKAWVSFNGNTGTVNGTALNTTVSRTAEGKYTLTWGTDFDSTNYAIAGFVADSVHSVGFICNKTTDTPLAAGTATIETRNHGGTPKDYDLVVIMAIGNQ